MKAVPQIHTTILYFFFFFFSLSHSGLFRSSQEQTLCRGLRVSRPPCAGLELRGCWCGCGGRGLRGRGGPEPRKWRRAPAPFRLLLHRHCQKRGSVKTSGVLMGSPPPSCPIKVSPLRLLFQTSTKSELQRSPQPVPGDPLLCISFSLS